MKPRDARLKVLIRARVLSGSGWSDACVRDISRRGMLIQASAPPVRGSYVEVRWQARSVVGRVVWVNDTRFGLQTRDALNVAAITSGITSPAQTAEGIERPLSRRLSGRDARAGAALSAAQARHISSAMQYWFFGGAVAIASAVLAGAVLESLSSFQTIAWHLSPLSELEPVGSPK
jgi:hypothetical protein